MIDPKYTKPVSSLNSSQKEISTVIQLSGTSLEFSLCDRTSLTNNRGNYFSSFNLPAEASSLSTASTLSLLYPELHQLNVDQIIICKIPSSAYTEFIDGRSVNLNLSSIVTPDYFGINMYSNTYSSYKSLKYGETSPLLGDNIVYLFTDTINNPYTGYTFNEIGELISHSANTTWEVTDLTTKFGAVSYLEVQGSVNALKTDTKTASYAVTVPSNYPAGFPGYNYDIPAGFAVLDKGFLVITHPQILTAFTWTTGYNKNGSAFTGTSVDSKVNIHFSDSDIILKFVDLKTRFYTTAVCLILLGEFEISNNRTWDRAVALSQFGNYSPLNITEIGLYNAFGELVAVSKLSEPLLKDPDDILNINVTLEM